MIWKNKRDLQIRSFLIKKEKRAGARDGSRKQAEKNMQEQISALRDEKVRLQVKIEMLQERNKDGE